MSSTERTPVATRKRVRASHTKSRHGCFACKSRKVKCDELKPVCGSCSLRELTCEYPVDPPGPGPSKGSRKSTAQSKKPDRSTHSSERLMIDRSATNSAPASPHPLQFAQCAPTLLSTGTSSESLNMIDLQLLSHFLTHTIKHMSLNHSRQHVWETVIPRFAARYGYLMHLQLALAGLDYFFTEEHGLPADIPASHLQVVIRHHQRGLAGFRSELGVLSADNAEHVFAGALLLVGFAFASLRVRNLGDLNQQDGQHMMALDRPRLDWIYLIRGLSTVVSHHWRELKIGALREMTEYRYATDEWQAYPRDMFSADSFLDQSKLGSGRLFIFCRGACDAIARLRAFHASISEQEMPEYSSDQGTPSQFGSQEQLFSEQGDAIDIMERMYLRILFVALYQRDDERSGLAVQADIEETAVMGWPETLSKGFLRTLDGNNRGAMFSWVTLAYLYTIFCILDGFWFLRGAFGEEVLKIDTLIHASGHEELVALMQWPVSLVASEGLLHPIS